MNNAKPPFLLSVMAMFSTIEEIDGANSTIEPLDKKLIMEI